jgi:hemerythrin superfamily protein
MNALDVIKRDHRAAEELINQFKGADDDTREAMESRIFAALTAHEKMEDDLFYPALSAALGEDDTVDELKREQTILETEVAAVRALPMGRAAALELALGKVLDHAHKEEQEIFPKAESALGADELEALGTQMEPYSAVANES